MQQDIVDIPYIKGQLVFNSLEFSASSISVPVITEIDIQGNSFLRDIKNYFEAAVTGRECCFFVCGQSRLMRFTRRFFSQTFFSVLMRFSVCLNPSTQCFSTSQCIQEIAQPQHALAPCFWNSVRVMRTMEMSQCFSRSRRTICSFGSGFVCECLLSLVQTTLP